MTPADKEPLDPEIARPLSAPPVPAEEEYPSEEGYNSKEFQEAVGWRTEQDGTSLPERAFSPGAKLLGQATVPAHRELMVFANRQDYRHYYRMPANVGLQNVPFMITEMLREGCKLSDIQITFEVEELK